MTIITLDNEGRITLPEDIRQQLKLKEGQELSLCVKDGKLIMKPRREATLHFIEGFPVFSVEPSEADTDYDIVAAIQQMRDERDRHNLGL